MCTTCVKMVIIVISRLKIFSSLFLIANGEVAIIIISKL